MVDRLVNFLLACSYVEDQDAIPIAGEDFAKTKYAWHLVSAGNSAFRLDRETEAIVHLSVHCERSKDGPDDDGSTDRDFAIARHHG